MYNCGNGFNLDTRLNEFSASVSGRCSRVEWALSTHRRRSGTQICCGRVGEEISYANRNSNPESFRPHLSQYAEWVTSDT